MKRTKTMTAALAALLLSACADRANSIDAAYVPSRAYMAHPCGALRAEKLRVEHAERELAYKQDKAADTDAWIVAGGVLLFWPALFLLEGDTGNEGSIARARGEGVAIVSAMNSKGC